MKKFIITQQEINLIVNDLREAPAKYSFNALRVLEMLRPLETQVEKKTESNDAKE